MKNLILLIAPLFFAFLSVPALAVTNASSTEDWKGQYSDHSFDIGAMGGLGDFRGSGGFGLLGNVAKEVLPHGFVPDIDDAVFVEAQAGPYLVQGGTDFHFSLHLRWDFAKDLRWTLYALAGVAGDITGTNLGTASDIYPRLGAGAMWKVSSVVWLRGEFSHEFVGVGILFPF